MRRVRVVLLSFVVAAAAVSLPGGAAQAIDPPRVRVTPGVSSVLAGGSRQLTATVTGLDNTAVTWTVRSGAGSVAPSGLYTAPATAPADPVAVLRAVSAEDASVYGEATVTVGSGVAASGFGPSVAVTEGAYKVRSGDVNGDGVADLVRAQGLANDIKTFRFVTMTSNGNGGFTESVSAVGSVYTQPNGFSTTSDYIGDFDLGDLDGDGDLDIVIAFGSHSAQTYREQVWRNSGTGTWTPDPKVLADQGGARSGPNMRLADFDGDGQLDLVRLDPFGSTQLQKGTGTGTFGGSVPLFQTSGAGREFAVGDLTGDGRPEVVVGTQSSTYAVERTFEVAVNDGFGNIASETTYTAGLNPAPYVYDATGDGWNDLVVAIGGDGATNDPPKTMVHANLGTGTGAVAATGTQVFAFRPYSLEPVHIDGDDVLDLAGTTFRGPFLATRTGSNAFSAVHAGTTFSASSIAAADVTGDDRVDVYAANDYESRFFPGSADGTLAFAINPTVTHVNATKQATFTASVRNSPTPVAITWTASRGTWVNDFFATSSRTYTAPATAAPEGTPVRITAALPGVPSASHDITVFNDRFQAYSLGGQQVRQVVRDPAVATTLYAATATGVYRSTTNGATFQLLGTTATTGTDARQLTVVKDGAAAQVVAVFGTTVYRYDLTAATDWTATGVTGAAGVSAAPGTGVVFAAAGNQVHRSADGGLTWTPLGGTSVNGVEAVDATTVWVRRSVAPRVNVGTVADGALTLAARALPVDAVVTALAVDPADRATAYVATASAADPLYRGDAATGTWTELPVPAAVDAVSVAPGTGHLLAADSGTNVFWKSRDDGTSWYDVNRGFPTTVLSVAHRADGLDLAGTASGLYVPVATTGPAAPEVTSGPAGTTAPGGANAFSFTFTGTGSSYLCAIDGTAWTACTSPKTVSGPLGAGSHTFSVVAVDADGDESAPGTHTWTVDATPAPAPEITAGPSGPSQGTTATFEFTLAGDAAGAVCALDNAAFTACTSPKQYTSLSQVAHTFAVRSVDAYGNQSASVTRSFTPDATPPPFPTFHARPDPYSGSPDAYFAWTYDGTATYACTLDDVAVPCTGMYSTSTLTEGHHYFEVIATDAVGNANGNGYSWTVDLTAPEQPTFSVTPAAETLLTDASFEFETTSTQGLYGYYCTLDDGSPQYCYGSKDYTGLAVGPHTFTVSAYDQAGRQSEPATFSWTITTPAPPPVPVIDSGPTGLVASRTAAFAYTLAEGLTARCSLDGAAPAACPLTGITYSNVQDGAHTFAVYAADAEGDLSAAATRSWTVDATAPATPVLKTVPALRTKSTSASFTWDVVEGLTYSCAVDGVAVACGTGSYAAPVTEGVHTFWLSAEDAAGNDSGLNAYSWTVDVTGPLPVVGGKPAALTKSTAVAFTLSVEAADFDHYTCTLDDVAVDCSEGGVTTTVGHGTHLFQVMAFDDLGNWQAASHSWTVDTQAPAAPAFLTKPAARTDIAGAGFTWTPLDGVTYACALDGAQVTCGTGSYTPPPAIGDGAHTFALTASDAAGNAAEPATHAWTLDREGPQPVIDVKPAAVTKSTTARFEFSSTAADLDHFTCTIEYEPVACADGVLELTGLTGGPRRFHVTGHDDLGNTAVAAYEWYVDLSAPSVTIGTPGVSLTAPRVVYFDQPAYGVSASTVKLLLTGTQTAVPVSIGCRDNANVPVPCGDDNVRDAVVTPVSPLVPGQSYTLRVTGITDAVGNVAEPDTATFRASTVEQEGTVGAKAAWRKVASSAAQGGSYSVTDIKGATASYAFTGTGITLTGIRGPSFGKADLFVDGETRPRATVSFYSSSAGTLSKAVTGLTNAKHTLKVVVRGEKGSTSGTGTSVGVDAVKVGATTTTSPAFTFAWATRAATSASGGKYALEDNAGASYTVTFRGTAFTWVTALGPTMGKATVKIDSAAPVTVDNYASAAKYGYARKFSGLADKVHTVTITVLGTRRSGATGSYVVFDRFGLT